MTNRDGSITRRAALAGLGLCTSAGILPFGISRAPAQAGSRVVVGTWGGDFARLLTKNIEDPILKPQGFEVIQDQAGDSPRRAKLMAEKRLARGSTDIQALSAPQMYEMNEAGVLEAIDYARVPNAANLLAQLKYPYGVGHIFSGKVAVYNPKLVSTPPTSFKEVFDPKHGSKHGIIDIQYQYVMAVAALAAGGTVSNYEPGKALLMEIKKAGVRVYPTNEAFAQALKNEEIQVGVMWKARVVQWQNSGISVESTVAKEGLPMYVSGFAITKNAPNKDVAYAYVNAMLDKGAQENFASDMGYNPSVTNATVAPNLLKRIGFTEEEQRRLIDLDYAYLAKNDQALKEWWDKVFKA